MADVLVSEQFTFGVDDRGVEYVRFKGRLTKTVSGAIDSKAKEKDICHFADSSNPRCMVCAVYSSTCVWMLLIIQ